MRMSKLFVAAGILAVSLLLSASPAIAIPALQIYIEGSSYDASSETWLTTSSTSRLWVIGSFTSAESILVQANMGNTGKFNYSVIDNYFLFWICVADNYQTEKAI